MFLSKTELRDMVRAKHTPKVRRELMRLRVPFKLDADGFPIVLRSAAEAAFSKVATRAGPDLAALENLRGKTEARRRAA